MMYSFVSCLLHILYFVENFGIKSTELMNAC